MPSDIQPVAEIQSKDVTLDPKTGTYQFSDEAMLKLILDDTKISDAWMNQQQWASKWEQSDLLYQSPTSSFDGIAGMSVPKFTVSNICNAVVPKIMGALFYDSPPFVLRARPGTANEVIRAKTAVFSFQLDDMSFEEEIEVGWDQNVLLGTMIFKWGWEEKEIVDKNYERESNEVSVDTPMALARVSTPDSDKFKIVYETKQVHRPWVKWCDVRTVLVDPGCRRGDIRKAKYVVYRDYATWADLDALRGVEGYDIPDEDTLKKFFIDASTPKPDNMAMTLPENMRGWLQHALPRNQKSSADPLQNGLEILERWDNEKVGVALRYKDENILIRNEANSSYGKKPFLSSTWRNNPDAFYGQGLGQLIGTEQMVEQGTETLALGMLSYGLQPTAVRKAGFNAISQPTIWEQGGIITVEDDVDKSFKFLEFPKVPPEAWAFIQKAQADAAETSGANQQFTMGAGAAGIKTTGARSGTGAALVGQASASRLDGPMERFIRQVFVPWLYQMDELNNDKLPTSALREILGQEIGEDFKVDDIAFRKAKVQFDVLAGAHLGAKKEMLQFLPFVLNVVNNPTIMELAAEQGWYFDFIAWFASFCDLAGFKWNQNFFKRMNQQQQQVRAANSPAGIQKQKGAQASSMESQKFQQTQREIDQEQLGKAAEKRNESSWNTCWQAMRATVATSARTRYEPNQKDAGGDP